jgi:septal ring factor EnvC (AmiA/AmiB activator)
MNDKLGTFIVMLIQTIVFATPVLLLMYKQGRKDQIIDEVVKDVNGMGKKIAEIRDSQTGALSELKTKIDNMDRTLIEAVTTIKHLSKSIEDLKK